jgi:hypothetical protein
MDANVTLSLRIGYKASAGQFDPTSLLSFSMLAEERGFDSVAISDSFQPWRQQTGHTPAVLPWLGALGRATSSIQSARACSHPRCITTRSRQSSRRARDSAALHRSGKALLADAPKASEAYKPAPTSLHARSLPACRPRPHHRR